MSKQAQATEAKEVAAPAAEPTIADLMAVIAALQKQVVAQAAPATGVTAEDFAEHIADAEKAGFKPQLVASLQKGASVALRTDF